MAHGQYILDEDGRTPVPCEDLLTWGKWFQEGDQRRRVARDDIGDVTVSTVFLGLDHQFGGGEPLLFETMILGGEHDQYQERYSTWEQAMKGHTRAVAKLFEA